MSVVTILPESSCKHVKNNVTNTPTNSLKSMDSIYSIAGSKFSALSRRKGIQKSRNNHPILVPVASEIKQRVSSARMLRLKQLQNQISEAHHRISELTAENRLLKALHKRQDSALTKYESSSAELPQLLNSHAEELRMWQTRCRNLQRQNKDLVAKVKQKDTIILTLTDQNKTFLALNKDKNLLERSNLQERVKELEMRLSDKESEMKLLLRRLQLESKSYRSNIQNEQQKYRDLLSKIEMSDFLLTRDGKKAPMKPNTKPIRNLSPSSNRITSKSATNLTSTVSGASSADHHQQQQTTTILPPCNNNNNSVMVVKKTAESVKNNSPCVNGNVKLMPETNGGGGGGGDDHNEVNLTGNYIDKSEKLPLGFNGDSDDLVENVRNGMNRARRLQQQQQHLQQQQQKATTKLAPINAQAMSNSKDCNQTKGSEKRSTDGSELSDDDDDALHFFSNHNGTKMATHQHLHSNNSSNNKNNTFVAKNNNAKDLLEHKLHINELENRMRRNSLEIQKPQPLLHRQLSYDDSDSSSPETITNCVRFPDRLTNGTAPVNSKKPINTSSPLLNDRGDSEIMKIHNNDIRRESLLDDLCDSLADSKSLYSAGTIKATAGSNTKLEFVWGGSQNNNNNAQFSNINSNETHNGNNHAKTNGGIILTNGKLMDDKKKSRLLAALKHIDNGSSLEN